MSAKRLLLFIVILLVALQGAAQPRDSIPPRDTLAIYKKIKKFAYKRKFTILLFNAIFIDPAPQQYEVKPLSYQQMEKDPNLKFNGKIIRKIIIEVYDPFGHSVNDTNRREINGLQRLANKYHLPTRQKVIRNMLLFKASDTLEISRITESERLIRTARYVNDARIYILQNDSIGKDSVDIKVVVQDKWAIDAFGELMPTGGNIKIRDKNILGSGQQFEQYLAYTLPDKYEFSGRYTVANISNTFLSSVVIYKITNTLTQTGVFLNRPFYSSNIKWAGGTFYVKTWGTYTYTDTFELQTRTTPLNFYNYDGWLARSIPVKSLKRINHNLNNLILGARYAQTRYQQRPSFDLDTGKLYVHTELYLGNIGISASTYYKDQYIFRFGANEDIPEGMTAQLLYGLQYKEENGIRYYAGAEASRGGHIKRFGYMSATGAYGTFFNKSVACSPALNISLTYFTDLLWSKRNMDTRSRWYFRQFAYFKYVYGFNKPSYELITLRPEELYGFTNGSIKGNSKLLLNLESILYAPYNLIGFRFAPLALCGFGMLQTDQVKLFNSKVYQSYALGVLIRNESLLNPTIKITIGLYPNLPDGSKTWFKFNPVTSFTVRIRSFVVSKPELVRYE